MRSRQGGRERGREGVSCGAVCKLNRQLSNTRRGREGERERGREGERERGREGERERGREERWVTFPGEDHLAGISWDALLFFYY